MAYAFALKASILGFLNALDPAIIDGSSLAPNTLPAGATAKISSAHDAVAFCASSSAVTIDTIPLPGTTGTPIPGTGASGPQPPSKGTLSLTAEITASGTGSTNAGLCAVWQAKATWNVQTSGSPVACDTSVTWTLTSGWNGSTASAAPSTWTPSFALDGTSKNVFVKLTATEANGTTKGVVVDAVTNMVYVQ
jgi:hypothetical protein